MNALCWYHWLIVILPVSAVLWLAFWCRRYSRGVADFLSAGRVAGRYVISVAGLMEVMCVLGIVAGYEATYQTGFAMGYWGNLLLPVGVFLGLCGWVSYRFRETCAMSGGQFLEMRYSRPFRVFATFVRVTAELLANCIGPAVAARFFIYLLGLPHRVHVCGAEVSMFVVLLVVCISLALAVTLAGGRISLIVTDCVQGLMSYPIFVIFAVFILTNLSWSDQIAPVMGDRVHGESFLSPYDIRNLRDFNAFALVVSVFGRFFGAIWLGNDTSTTARTPHEQKMAGILGTWRGGFSGIFSMLLVIFCMTVLNHRDFSGKAHEIRQSVAIRVIDQIFTDEAVSSAIKNSITNIPEHVHVIAGRDAKPLFDDAAREIADCRDAVKALDRSISEEFKKIDRLERGSGTPGSSAAIAAARGEIARLRAEQAGVSARIGAYESAYFTPGKDMPADVAAADPALAAAYAEARAGAREATFEPLARGANPDTLYQKAVLDAIHCAVPDEAAGNQKFQNFRSTYNQMMLPGCMRKFFPPALLALFIMLMILMMVSTDDSRIFNSSSTIVQDLIIPFFKTPPSPERHVGLIKIFTVVVGVIFFLGSLFMTNLDFLNLFLTIVISIWGGGAGAVVVFGLYSRRGTTAGAYASIIAGGGSSVLGMLVQRNWADAVFPWLDGHGLAAGLRDLLAAASGPFQPWIDWDVPMREGINAFAVKFPVNSTEISFIAMLMGIAFYWIVSLLDHAITKRPNFNLERMLHRGVYNTDPDKIDVKIKLTWKRLLECFVSITPDYTKGDRVITWAMFFYSIVYQFLFAFVAVAVWNIISPWPAEYWAKYFLWTMLIVPCAAATVTTVWFLWGGIRDMKALFRDLDARKRNALDNGMVEGNVSLADREIFARREKEANEKK